KPMLRRRERSSTKPMACCSVTTSRQRAPGGSGSGRGVATVAAGADAGGGVSRGAASGARGAGAAGSANRSSSWPLLGIPFGIELAHFPFDPGLYLGVELVGGDSLRFYRGPDGHGDHARPLHERIAAPAFAGIVRHR